MHDVAHHAVPRCAVLCRLCCVVLLRLLQGWQLHVWGDVNSAPAWGHGLAPSGFDDGPYWELSLKASANHVGVLVYKGDSSKGEEKAAGGYRQRGCIQPVHNSVKREIKHCLCVKSCSHVPRTAANIRNKSNSVYL